jgi:hypothetical protein
MPPNERDILFAREAADRLLRRALIDASFREKLKLNPDGAFADAGLDARTAEDLVREITLDGRKLSEHSSLISGCVRTCTNTCWITCIMTDPAT